MTMKTVLGLTWRYSLFALLLALDASITYAARRNGSIKIRHGRPKTDRRRLATDSFDFDLMVSEEKRLTKFLYQRYSRLGRGGRPVMNSSQVVLVRFGLAMIQMDLDERQNMLTSSDWCRYRWVDEYLRWDPEDFGGSESIRMSSNRIWIPDIMLYNTAHTQKLERDVLAVVKYNGEVQWIPHRTYKASCAVDVRNFPFDIQTCHMTFGSWSYHGNEIDLGHLEDMEMLDVSDLERESTAWDIVDKTENRKASYYDCCKDPYVTLTFTLRLKRKLVFSSFILTLPCIFLACMTLVVFWLPPERPDRTSLAMSLFSSFLLLLLILVEAAPPTASSIPTLAMSLFASFLLLLLILVEAAPPTASSIPTLGVYYCFNMVVIMLSIFLSSIVINISRRGINMTPVPRWLQSPAMNRLSRMLCVTIQQHPRPRAVLRNLVRQGLLESQNVIANEDLTIPLRKTCQENGGVNECRPRTERDGTSESSGDRAKADVVPLMLSHDSQLVSMLLSHFFKMEKCLNSIDLHLKEVMASVKLRDVSKEMRDIKFEWQTIAMTMDRLLFFLFVIAIVTSLLLLFPRPEHLVL